MLGRARVVSGGGRGDGEEIVAQGVGVGGLAAPVFGILRVISIHADRETGRSAYEHV